MRGVDGAPGVKPGVVLIPVNADGSPGPGVKVAFGYDNMGGIALDKAGNIYVAAAKRLLKGLLGIDAEAGPTEIMIIADDSADARCVAADLISQAEHDPLAAAVLVTDSEELAEAVVGELALQVPATKHHERITEALSGAQSAIVLVDSIATAVAVANTYGAEHLEIHTADAPALVQELLTTGQVLAPEGHLIRTVAFGNTARPHRSGPWHTVPLEHLPDYPTAPLAPNWAVLGRTQLKADALGPLLSWALPGFEILLAVLLLAIFLYLLPLTGALGTARAVVMGLALVLAVATGVDYLVRALRLRATKPIESAS